MQRGRVVRRSWSYYSPRSVEYASGASAPAVSNPYGPRGWAVLGGVGGRETRAGSWEDSCRGGEPGPTRAVVWTGAQSEVLLVPYAGARRRAVLDRGGAGVYFRPELSAGTGGGCGVFWGGGGGVPCY